MALAILIFRNLTKLFFERRQRVVGARLRTRLVVAFVGLASLPALLLFLVSLKLITTSVQGWFDVRVEEALRLAADLAADAPRSTERTALGQAQRLAEEIVAAGPDGPGPARNPRPAPAGPGAGTRRWRAVAYYGGPAEQDLRLGSPELPDAAPPLPRERLLDAWAGRSGLSTSGGADGRHRPGLLADPAGAGPDRGRRRHREPLRPRGPARAPRGRGGDVRELPAGPALSPPDPPELHADARHHRPAHHLLRDLVRLLPLARHHHADPAAGRGDPPRRRRRPRFRDRRPGPGRDRAAGGLLQPDDPRPEVEQGRAGARLRRAAALHARAGAAPQPDRDHPRDHRHGRDRHRPARRRRRLQQGGAGTARPPPGRRRARVLRDFPGARPAAAARRDRRAAPERRPSRRRPRRGRGRGPAAHARRHRRAAARPALHRPRPARGRRGPDPAGQGPARRGLARGGAAHRPRDQEPADPDPALDRAGPQETARPRPRPRGGLPRGRRHRDLPGRDHEAPRRRVLPLRPPALAASRAGGRPRRDRERARPLRHGTARGRVRHPLPPGAARDRRRRRAAAPRLHQPDRERPRRPRGAGEHRDRHGAGRRRAHRAHPRQRHRPGAAGRGPRPALPALRLHQEGGRRARARHRERHRRRPRRHGARRGQPAARHGVRAGVPAAPGEPPPWSEIMEARHAG